MQSHYTTTTTELVPPHRIEQRHPPALQAGAQTTYAREALLIGTPRENRTPTKRFGNSCAATTPARQLFDGGRPWSSNQDCFPQGTGVTARRCTRHSARDAQKLMVRVAGLEPATSSSQARRGLPTAPHPDWKRVPSTRYPRLMRPG